MKRYKAFSCLLVLCALCLAHHANAQPAIPAPTGNLQVALVIGNAKYQDGELDNPVNDANDVAAVFSHYGFEVVKVLNGDKKGMRDALRRFGDMLGPKSVAVLFYAGHGLQINGKNYLIPVNANIKAAEDVEDQGVALDGIMKRLAVRRPRFNIVILDACRNNPFAARSSGAGLASVDAPAGSLIAFATGPSKVAFDGAGRNGLYTSHLLRHINSPDLKIEEIFKRVRMGVMEQSAGAQVPWENTSLTEDFILNPRQLVASPTGAAAADTSWVASAGYEQLKAYLAAHPADTNREQVTLALVQVNANRPLRKEALRLAFAECDKCPKLTELPVASGQKKRYIGTDLITMAEYQQCVAAGACRDTKAAGADTAIAALLPVSNVSLNDATQYVQWVNRLSHSKRYRIPSQQEWMEVFQSGYFLPSGRTLATNKSLCEIGNFYDLSGAVVSAFPWNPNTCNDGFPFIAPVGMFMPSLDGVFDLVGNLWQWTTSCQGSDPGVAGSKCAKSRLVGGSWATAPRWSWQNPPEIASEPELATDLFGIRVMAQDL